MSVSALARGQEANLFKDLYPGSGSGYPQSLTESDGVLYFAAYDGAHGKELWKSDGTEAGTVLVKDINPSGSSSPGGFTGFGGALYFQADDGTHGRELWTSDGTEAGTVLVKDINPSGYSSSIPYFFAESGSTLYFAAYDYAHGYELWRTDGTEAGTVLVKDIRKDIRPGSSGSNPYVSAESGGALGGALYFQADDGTRGQELWTSDGTEAGTVLVKDINPGSDGSGPYFFAESGGALYFQADDGTHGRELWRTDGTEAGTVLVKDISPGSDSGYPASFAVAGGALYFQADDGTHGKELWKVNTTAVSAEVEPAVPGPLSLLLSAPYPNPSSGASQLTLTAENTQHVRVAVFDVLGREVARLLEGPVAAGSTYPLTWAAAGQASGLYVVRVQGETSSATQPLLLWR